MKTKKINIDEYTIIKKCDLSGGVFMHVAKNKSILFGCSVYGWTELEMIEFAIIRIKSYEKESKTI